MIQSSTSISFWQFGVQSTLGSREEEFCGKYVNSFFCRHDTLLTHISVEILLRLAVMLRYHSGSDTYQMLWELFYNNPGRLGEAAHIIFSRRNSTLGLSEMGLDLVFPYLPLATPSTLSFATQLRTEFKTWMESSHQNSFIGKFILFDTPVRASN